MSVTYEHADPIATITMDDGKVNALGPAMQRSLGDALDRAESDRAVVVLRGRAGRFSAGFDLDVLRAGGDEALGMLRGGFGLALRLLTFPRPVVVACTGHAIAMGLFLVQSGDRRIGSSAPYTLVANEVAIGLTLPYAAVAILRLRLAPSVFQRAAVMSESFGPDSAVEAGLLDAVVAPEDFEDAVRDAALAAAQLDPAAHAATKLRARAQAVDAIRAGIESEFGTPDASQRV